MPRVYAYVIVQKPESFKSFISWLTLPIPPKTKLKKKEKKEKECCRMLNNTSHRKMLVFYTYSN